MQSKIREIKSSIDNGEKVESIILNYLKKIDELDGNLPVLCRTDEEIEKANQLEFIELEQLIQKNNLSNNIIKIISNIRNIFSTYSNKDIFESLGGMPPTMAIVIAISILNSESIKENSIFIDIALNELRKLDKIDNENLIKVMSNRYLHSFIYKFEKETLIKKAKEYDNKISQSSQEREKLPLAGVTIAVKDVFAFGPTTAASKIMANYIASDKYIATSIKKLIDYGAIVIGKTNLDEFALGSSNESTAFCFFY